MPASAAVVNKEETPRPAIFNYLEHVSSTLNVSGPRRGSYTVKYKCCAQLPTGDCGATITGLLDPDGGVNAREDGSYTMRAGARLLLSVAGSTQAPTWVPLIWGELAESWEAGERHSTEFARSPKGGAAQVSLAAVRGVESLNTSHDWGGAASPGNRA